MSDEDNEEWFFTFGGDHTHPVTGATLGQSYVVVYGTCNSTRDDMFRMFGNRWSNQYQTAALAGVDQFDLRRIPMPLPPIGAVAHCVCCTYDCGDRRGHIRETIRRDDGDCVCGRDWPCALSDEFTLQLRPDGSTEVVAIPPRGAR